MTKHLRFLIVLLMTLVWSTGGAQEVTMDFTDNTSWKIPTSQTAKEQKFGTGNNEITLSNAYYYSTNYLMLKKGGTLTFTTFTFDVEKIVITGNSNASPNTKQNIYVGNVAVSSQTIGSTSTNTYLIKDGYQSAGNRYVLKVLDKNAQITKIQIYKKESSSNKTSTTITFPKQSLTYATTDDLTTFTGQTATLTADGTALTGKTITYSKSGDNIFSSFDATNGKLALNGNAGTATVTATFNGSNDDTYASSSASYTISVNKVYTTLASFKADISSKTEKAYCLKLTDAIVTYVNGQKAYLQDATSGVLVFGTNAFGLNVGEKYTGIVNVSACLYNGMAEITDWNPASDIVKTENVDIPVATVTLEQLNGVDYSKYECVRVKVENAKITTPYSTAKKATITQGEQQYLIYGEVKGLDVNQDDVCDFVGYPMYNKTSSLDEHRLSIWSQDDIVFKYSVVATTLSFNTETTAFNVEKNSESSFVAPTAVVKDDKDNVVAGAKITYESNEPTIASVDGNGKVTFGSKFGKATITARYAGDDTHKSAADIFYTITYSKIPTEMAWSKSSVSVNIGEVLSAPTLTLTAHGGDILAGKKIQYSSSDKSVAEIDATSGIITIGSKDGSTTITATFVGDDTYEEATAKYTLNVIDPNKTDVTFDFTKPEDYGYDKPVSGGKTELSNGGKLVSNRVIITNVKGSTSTTTRFKDDSGNVTFRVYAGAILTVEAPAGFAINKIDFTDNGSQQTVDNFTFSTGELSSKTWTGLANKLTMEVATGKQVFLKSMIVNLVKVENVTLNESANNTIEAKALANVTLNRTMKAGVWNTICLPFDVSKEQATTAFGEGVKIAELDENSTGTTLSFKNVDVIKAKIPYLIKPSDVKTSNEYVFENVNIDAENINPGFNKTADGFAFVGIYDKADITENIKTRFPSCYAAFLGANNTVYKANPVTVPGKETKGFRAYFAIPTSVKASELRVVIDGTATSIKNINSEVVESNAPVYNLQGQRVDGNNLTPGIYVKAGKKFVVK